MHLESNIINDHSAAEKEKNKEIPQCQGVKPCACFIKGIYTGQQIRVKTSQKHDILSIF